jgi:ribosomal protein S18 acetylase RimI-like enzyme
MSINIRFSNEVDIIAKLNEPVQELHKKLYSEYFKNYSYLETKWHIQKQLADENWKCLMAAYNNVDVGYALFFIREYKDNPFRNSYKGIHIDQISVLGEYRKKGIGKALMNEIYKYAEEKGATQIELLHWEKNEEAKLFYEKQGFETQMRFIIKKLL